MIATEDAANSSDEDLKRLAEVINYTASDLKRDSYKDPIIYWKAANSKPSRVLTKVNGLR